MLTIRINPAMFNRPQFQDMNDRDKRSFVYHLDEPSFDVTNVPVMPDPRSAKLVGDQPYVAGQSRNRDLCVTMTGTQLDENTLNLVPLGSGTLRGMIGSSIARGDIIVTNDEGRDLTFEDIINSNWN
jgi:hypothetical protein